jgi:hypothetical protein
MPLPPSVSWNWYAIATNLRPLHSAPLPKAPLPWYPCPLGLPQHSPLDAISRGDTLPSRPPMSRSRNALPKPPAEIVLYARILYGWREVAAYLRRSSPTVKRWHAQRAMPISWLGDRMVIPVSALDIWVLEGRTRKTVRGPGDVRARTASEEEYARAHPPTRHVA